MKASFLLPAMLAIGVSASTAAPQSYYDFLHCIHDDDLMTVISACTRFIEDSDVAERDKLAAYYSRGLAWRESGHDTRAEEDFALWRRLFDSSQINSNPNLRLDPFLRR